MKQSPTSHFDRRGTTYDQDQQVHHRIVSLLVAGADLRPKFRVLDIATRNRTLGH